MLDLESLLQPIADNAPAGDDISFSHEFDQIQEARRRDDASLDQGEWVTELKTADWNKVSQLCSDLLQRQSKDLRLAAWLTEASTHLEGFAGLAQGYRLVAELSERFWDDMHPIIENGDIDARVGNMGWLLSQSISWMRGIPLTHTPEASYTATDIEIAVRAHGTGEEADVSLTDIGKARDASGFEFYQQLAEQLPQARAALQQLEAVIDDKLGVDGPSFSAVRDAFEKVADSASRLAGEAGAGQVSNTNTTDPQATPENTPLASQQTGQTVAPQARGPIASRNDALQQLQQVADYFRRTEPHSPVAYLAERAARWGKMPLHVWLKTVLKEENGALGRLEELLGVENDQDTYQ